jgi:hypothetical protein
MTFEPITDAEAKELGRRLDIELVAAPVGPDTDEDGDDAVCCHLYHELNTNYRREDGWHPLRGPVVVGDYLVIPVARPRDDSRGSANLLDRPEAGT